MQGAEPKDFSLEGAKEPAIHSGEVLLQNLYLSIDPYLYLGLRLGRKANGAVEPGSPMRGRVVAQVLESKDPKWRPGDIVLTVADWAERARAPAHSLTRIEATEDIPLSAWLGPVGQSGLTAWVGLVEVAKAKQGDTVVVTAAAGAVGSVAGQLARIRGCRVIGIAGGSEKVRHVIEELRFHQCLDYKAPDFSQQLAASVPHGVDVLFENVGGAIFDKVLPLLNRKARIALCGMVSQYRDPAVTLDNFHRLLGTGVRLEAFSVYDYLPRRQRIISRLVELIRAQQLHWRCSETQGLSSAPDALAAVMNGGNFGKQVVRVR